ncbi:AMP-binding protein [Chromatiaceae bacterium AAb-1]|nr:AMP-binding protein [Chromatiaceae bacterium AAb-1]
MNLLSKGYSWLVSRILFRLHETIKGHSTYRMLARLEASQWRPAQEIAQEQQQRLQQFMQYISRHNPYYQTLFAEHHISADSISTVADLARLPLLTKAMIKQHQQQLKSQPESALTRYNTGGSSGEPLIFFMGKNRISHDVAAKLRATRWWQVDIGDPEVVLWGSPIELNRQDQLKNLRDRLFRSYLLPAFELTPRHITHYLQQLQQIRPQMLFGYPSVLYQLALAAQQQQLDLHQLGIKVAFVTSEMLYDHQRQLIEQVFGCPVANGYGARDAGFIAHQCPAGSLHISAEDIIVEIIDQQGNVLPAGATGEIVITHLQTGAFPFVRYRTGDIGTLSTAPCSCGRGLPVLKDVSGRTTDFLLTDQGDKLHALSLIYILRDIPEILKFKIIQQPSRQVDVRYIASQPLPDNIQQQIINALSQRLGAGINITLTAVTDIPPLQNGKYRYVESKAT